MPIESLKKHGFSFISKLGAGGFGVVIKVKHEISGQFYAVKILRKREKSDPENILREIKAIASLKSLNIIRYNYSFVEDGELYLVMEFCSEGSLRDRLRKEGRLSSEFCCDIFLRLTHTFAFLHDKGFVHHDIKPDNILFTEKKVKIADFGTVNTKIGTIAYSAPEMLLPDAPEDDPRVDIFALGITFMECISGVNPLRNLKSWNEHLHTVKQADYPLQDQPYWLQQLLLKACHYDPSARFQTMKEFHEAIKRRKIPQIIDNEIISEHKRAMKLKMLVVGKNWLKAEKFIDLHSNNKSVDFLFYTGRYFLETNQLEKALAAFEEVLAIDRSTPVHKELAEIYLHLNEPSKAASMLHPFINRNFRNAEAHNHLLHSYFLSDQWEIGLEQASFLRKLFPKDPCFINNLALFEIMLGQTPSEPIHLNENNPIGYYNYCDVAKADKPSIVNSKNCSSLKSKLLFNEYKFRKFYKSKNGVTVEIDGKEFHSDKHVISIGRKGFNNTFSVGDSSVSRRHLVIVNKKNDVWLYDMSTLGTFVNGIKVQRRFFLLGRCEIQAGRKTIFVKSDRNLLL